MSAPIPAYHLPGLDESTVAEWDVRTFGDDVRLSVPVLEPAHWRSILAGLAQARLANLADRPVGDVLLAVDRVAARLQDRSDPARQLAESVLPPVTGYSPAMIRLILDRMAADWRADALDRMLRAELGDPAVLDRFVRREELTGTQGIPGYTRAFGPSLAFHVFAGNVPGVAVTAMIRALLVKAAVAGKAASGEPFLPALFARLLAETDPGLGACIAVTYWRGGTEALESTAIDAADAVIVYGGEAVVAAVRGRVPAATRLVVHGPRFSCGLVGREALTADAVTATAADVAMAVATFDQHGCVSPHVIYVESGGAVDAAGFAKALASALEEVQASLPRGTLSPEEAAAVHEARATAEFRGIAGHDVQVHASHGTEFTVIRDADPAFVPSCLNRVVYVKPLDDLAQAVQHLRPYARYLQTVGIAGAGARAGALSEMLGRMGASRITSFREMPWPPPHWHHDGTEPVRSLLRWTDSDA